MEAYNALCLVNTAELWFKLKVGKYGTEDDVNRSSLLPRCIQALEKHTGVEFPPGISNLADAAKGLYLHIQMTRGSEGYIAWINNTRQNGNLYLGTDSSGVIYRGHLTKSVEKMGAQQFNSLQDLLQDFTPAAQAKSRGPLSKMLGDFAYSIMAVRFDNCTDCCPNHRCCCPDGSLPGCFSTNSGSCLATGCPSDTWCCCGVIAGPERVSDSIG